MRKVWAPASFFELQVKATLCRYNLWLARLHNEGLTVQAKMVVVIFKSRVQALQQLLAPYGTVMLEFQGALCDSCSGGPRCEAFGKLPVLWTGTLRMAEPKVLV